MEDFQRIKRVTEEAVRSNMNNTTIIRQWKRDIRACIMRIKEKYNNLIDKFIYQFSISFKNVENSSEMMEFSGEDRKLTNQVEELQKKYSEIIKIFNNIASSTA